MYLIYKILFFLALLLGSPLDLWAGDPHLNAQVDQIASDTAAILQKMDGLQQVQWVQCGLLSIIIIIGMWAIAKWR